MSKKGSTSLNELMGKHGDRITAHGIDLHEDLPKILGENMPKLEFTPLGRIRLIQALRHRFGENFRNIPGIQEAIAKFDGESKTALEHYKIIKRLGRK